MNQEFEKDFGTLPTTLLFENTTMERLADYFKKEHPQRLTRLFPAKSHVVSNEELFRTTPVKTKSEKIERTAGPGEGTRDLVAGLSDAEVDALIGLLDK